MSEINVTPFVDVMLVLLIVFMVTAPLLTVGVPVDLPKVKTASALTDQKDGLIFYKRFAEVGKEVVKSGGWIILEVGLEDHPSAVKNIFSESGFPDTELIKDYNGDDRVLVIKI